MVKKVLVEENAIRQKLNVRPVQLDDQQETFVSSKWKPLIDYLEHIRKTLVQCWKH